MSIRIKKKEEAAKSAAVEAPRAVGPATQVPLVYADAVGNVLLSPINTRVTFVLHTGPAKDGRQPGLPTLELVIPTNALLGFLAQMQQHVKAQGPALVTALEETKKQFTKQLAEEEK